MTKELEVINHESEGDTKRLWQYKNSPIFAAILDTFTAKINEIEEQLTKFKTELQLDTATGINLDLIGDMLNSPFRPIDDEDFRRVLKALITAYNSEGRASDILDLLSKIVESDSITITDYGGAAFGAQMSGLPVLTSDDEYFIITAINLAKAAGVLFEGIVSTDFPGGDKMFSFNEDTSPNAGGFEKPSSSFLTFPEYVFSERPAQILQQLTEDAGLYIWSDPDNKWAQRLDFPAGTLEQITLRGGIAGAPDAILGIDLYDVNGSTPDEADSGNLIASSTVPCPTDLGSQNFTAIFNTPVTEQAYWIVVRIDSYVAFGGADNMVAEGTSSSDEVGSKKFSRYNSPGPWNDLSDNWEAYYDIQISAPPSIETVLDGSDIKLNIFHEDDSDAFFNAMTALMDGQSQHRNSITITDNSDVTWSFASNGVAGVVAKTVVDGGYITSLTLNSTNYLFDSFIDQVRTNDTAEYGNFDPISTEADFNTHNPSGLGKYSQNVPPYYSFRWNPDNDPAASDRVRVIVKGDTPFNRTVMEFTIKLSGQDSWRFAFQSEMQALADTLHTTPNPSRLVIWDRSGDKWVIESLGLGQTVVMVEEFGTWKVQIEMITNQNVDQYNVFRNGSSVPTSDIGLFTAFEGSSDLSEWTAQNGAGPQKLEARSLVDDNAGFITGLIGQDDNFIAARILP